jgi:hypothetical protein
LVRFGLRNVGDIGFQVISDAENSNKFWKTRFWKERSVEDVVTLGPTTAQATLVTIMIYIYIYQGLICGAFLIVPNSNYLAARCGGDVPFELDFFFCILHSSQSSWRSGLVTESHLHNSPRAAGLPCSSGLTGIASVPGYWTMISLEDWSLPSIVCFVRVSHQR